MVMWIICWCFVVGKVFADVTSNIKCSGTSNVAGSATYSSSTYTSDPDTNRAFTYVAETPNYTFKCCGVITKWEFVSGNAGTLQLQVWRRMSTSVYKLIGENYYSVTNAGTFTYNVETENQIVVQKGDFIGWHNQGEEILKYNFLHFSTSSLENMFHRINAGDLYPGATYDWSEVEAYNDRDYGLKVTYAASTSPLISTSATVTVPDYIAKSSTVTRVSFSDPDMADNSSLIVYQKKKASFYTFDATTGYVTSNNDLRPQTMTMQIAVYDTCLNLVQSTQTLTVSETALVLDLMDATFTISETQTSTLNLYTFTFTDPVDAWYCEWITTLPFMLKAASTTTYSLWVAEYPGLEYTTVPSYSMVVRCTEERAASTNVISGTIVIKLTENQPPVLSNTEASVTVDAETAVIGDTVFTATATDPESDVLTFTMTPATSASVPFIMMKNGAVQLTDWLILTTTTQYEMDVTVTDSEGNTDVGNLLISVANVDDTVVFTNVPPATILIKENTAIGTSIYRFLYEDLDYNTKIWSLTVSDNKFGRLLNLDPSTGLLTTAFSEINFEDLGNVFTYTLTLRVGDIKSSLTQTLQITVINENEAPRFTKENFHLDVDEAADGTRVTTGVIFTTSGYMVDEDTEVTANAESHEYLLDCDTATNTHRFYINPSSGKIKYRGPYDLDTADTPSQIECTITVVDKLGLKDTARLHIHINNVNEFSPQFTNKARTIYVSSNTLVGTSLLTVSASDFDSSDDDDNQITYSLDQSALGTTLFAINENGNIYTVASLTSYSGGQTLGPIYAQASNYLIASRTGTETITVVIPLSTTTTTTTTDRDRGFYEDGWNYYWLLGCLGGATIFILAMSLVCYRICRLTRVGPWCYRNCMKGICCRPKSRAPRGFRDMGYDLASFDPQQMGETDATEIDGWFSKARREKQFYKKEMKPYGRPTPIIVDADGRFGTPMTNYDEDLSTRNTPVYEMLRVTTPSAVPDVASYLDPYTGTRGTSWRNENQNKSNFKRSF